jgi:drug/metabolite transporter (DMT)-like permease
MHLSSRHQAYLALALNTVIWGAALPLVKPALEFVTPYQYLFYRYLIAAPLGIPVLIYLGHKYRITIKQILTIIGLELIGVTGALAILYEGLRRTSSLEATFIANTGPIFITVGGILLLKEKEERHELIGLIVAFAGVVILSLEPLATGRAYFNSPSFMGNLMILAYNVFWAVYILLAKKHYKNLPKLFVSFLSFWVGLITFGIIVFIANPHTIYDIQYTIYNPHVLLAALYMGLLGSIVAVPAYIFGNDKIEASEASLFTYLQPLITIPLAALWLHERVSPIMLLSLILTTCGVFIAEKRFKRLPSRKLP